MTRAEIIERMARAICAYQGHAWGAADTSHHDRWREMATAALSEFEAIIPGLSDVIEGRAVVVPAGGRWHIGRHIGDTFEEDDDFDGMALTLELLTSKDVNLAEAAMLAASPYAKL